MNRDSLLSFVPLRARVKLLIMDPNWFSKPPENGLKKVFFPEPFSPMMILAQSSLMKYSELMNARVDGESSRSPSSMRDFLFRIGPIIQLHVGKALITFSYLWKVERENSFSPNDVR